MQSMKVLPTEEDEIMASQLTTEETITVEELALSNSFEIAALVSVLEQKGILTSAEVIPEIGRLREQANR